MYMLDCDAYLIYTISVGLLIRGTIVVFDSPRLMINFSSTTPEVSAGQNQSRGVRPEGIKDGL